MTDSRVPPEIEIDLELEGIGVMTFNDLDMDNPRGFAHMVRILKYQNKLGKNIVGTIRITNEEHNTLYKEKSFNKK
jgi:hypothetical protein